MYRIRFTYIYMYYIIIYDNILWYGSSLEILQSAYNRWIDIKDQMKKNNVGIIK